MLTILSPGPQSTLQGARRTGQRHMGIPWAGAADDWSMALANRLVDNAAAETAIEITLGVFEVRFEQDTWFALTGAPTQADLSGGGVSFHATQFAPTGSVLKLRGARTGMRTYLAIAGGVIGEEFLGSASTYLPAGFGGYKGRALIAKDQLEVAPQPSTLEWLETPADLIPVLSDNYTLRGTPSIETHLLDQDSERALFQTSFAIGRQATRMGVSLEGTPLALNSDGKMKSVAVFPGAIQCPEDGTPIILLADAQTTGGYPRIASIARCDRHILGQLRPGNKVRLLKRTHEQSAIDLESKQALLRSWVPDYEL